MCQDRSHNKIQLGGKCHLIKKGDHIPFCCGKLMKLYDELFITNNDCPNVYCKVYKPVTELQGYSFKRHRVMSYAFSYQLPRKVRRA